MTAQGFDVTQGSGRGGSITQKDHEIYVRECKHNQRQPPMLTAIPITQIPVDPLHALINIGNARFQWVVKMAADHCQQGRKVVEGILLGCQPRIKRPITGFTGKACLELMDHAAIWVSEILAEHPLLPQILTSWGQIAWLCRCYAAISPSQEDIQAFQSRGAEHMQFMAQFKSSELSTQLTTDLQRAEGIADADAAAAGAPAETGQDAGCKYRFIPYDHFLCCTAHNFLTHYGGCGAFSAAIFEATNKDWKHASQHHVSKGGKGAQHKSRSLLRQQWAQTMPGTDIEEKVKANTRQDQRGATFLQPGSSLPAWPPSH